MKKTLLYKSILVLFISAFIISCSSDKPDDIIKEKENTFLVDYKKVTEYKKEDIISFVKQANTLYGNVITFSDKLKYGVDVYSITYNTTFQENKIVASGLVIIPKSDGVFPIFSFQNGTNTLHRNAPTANPYSYIIQMFNLVGSSGFISVIPDYLGFGASKNMFHPYLDKKSTVSSIVDMLKAVKELTDGTEEKITVKSSNDLYLSGYSQGGWSTMCLQKELELHHSKDFSIKASSCGAGPYNLETMIKYVLKQNTYRNPYFLAYVFNKMYQMGEANEELLKKIIQEPYASRLKENLFDGARTGVEINNELTTNISKLFTKNFIDNYETSADFKIIREWLRKNSVDFWKTNIPTRLYYGTADKLVPATTSQEAYNKMVDLGTDKSNLQLVPISNETHSSSFLPIELYTLQWFISLKNK